VKWSRIISKRLGTDEALGLSSMDLEEWK